MSFTFKGSYTQNGGDAPAAGTVEIRTRAGASLVTATLDAGGSYVEVIDAEEGEMKVIETMTGVAVRSYEASVSRGSVTDTSRDIGYTGPAAAAASSADLTTHSADTTAVHGITNTATLVVGTGITAVVALTQAAYDALSPPVATTLYVIVAA